MKKFSFSLQKLLNYKEQLFDEEQRILREMRMVLAGLEKELNDLRLDRAKRTTRYREKVLEGITIPEMDIHQKYMKVLDGYIDQKLAQIRFQQVVIDKQVERVREAKIEISTIEKLREKKLEEYNHIALKKAEEFIEEYVTTQTAMKAV